MKLWHGLQADRIRQRGTDNKLHIKLRQISTPQHNFRIYRREGHWRLTTTEETARRTVLQWLTLRSKLHEWTTLQLNYPYKHKPFHQLWRQQTQWRSGEPRRHHPLNYRDRMWTWVLCKQIKQWFQSSRILSHVLLLVACGFIDTQKDGAIAQRLVRWYYTQGFMIKWRGHYI